MNNTIFDDGFRTMIEKIPQLAIPLINEVFQTSYSEDVEIIQLQNEHHQENGEDHHTLLSEDWKEAVSYRVSEC